MTNITVCRTDNGVGIKFRKEDEENARMDIVVKFPFEHDVLRWETKRFLLFWKREVPYIIKKTDYKVMEFRLGLNTRTGAPTIFVEGTNTLDVDCVSTQIDRE
jgi:hypothetical protein